MLLMHLWMLVVWNTAVKVIRTVVCWDDMRNDKWCLVLAAKDRMDGAYVTVAWGRSTAAAMTRRSMVYLLGLAGNVWVGKLCDKCSLTLRNYCWSTLRQSSLNPICPSGAARWPAVQHCGCTGHLWDVSLSVWPTLPFHLKRERVGIPLASPFFFHVLRQWKSLGEKTQEGKLSQHTVLSSDMVHMWPQRQQTEYWITVTEGVIW